MISGFKFWKIYNAIHLHFSSKSYDAIKYNFKTKKMDRETFENRHDKTRFVYYASKLNDDWQAVRFCIFNFVHGDPNWVYDTSEKAFEIYNVCVGFYQAFTKNITDDYKLVRAVMKDKGLSFQDLLNQTASGNKPPLLQMLLKKTISKEYVAMLNREFFFIDIWLSQYSIDPLIELELSLIKKYDPFITILRKRK